MSGSNEGRGSGVRWVMTRLAAAAVLGGLGVTLLMNLPGGSQDTMLVTRDGKTIEVPVQSEVAGEFQDLLDNGVASQDPGVKEFAEELAQRRQHSATRRHWMLYGGLGCFAPAALFLMSALTGPPPPEPEAKSAVSE